MTLYADLYSERGIWRSDSAYVFALNDPLTVCFGEKHKGDTVSIRSARHVESFRLDESGSVDIDKKHIEDSSAIMMTVQRYVNGKCVGSWKVDPLHLLVNDGTVMATPWTVGVEKRLADLENAILGYSSPLFE